MTTSDDTTGAGNSDLAAGSTTFSTISPGRSLAGKLLIFGFVPTVVILMAAIGYAAWSSFEQGKKQEEVLLRHLAREIALEIERGNTRAVLAAEVMAEAQVSGMFGNRLRSTQYARRVLDRYPEFTGAYFGYEPNADQSDAGFLASPAAYTIRAALDDQGRFLPYWYRDRDDPSQIKLEPLINMESSLYYQGVRSLFQSAGYPVPIVTEPYVYEGKLIVEQTFPIVIDGKFKGIAGVDRALDDILRFLVTVAGSQGVDAFLISGGRRIIAATTARDEELRTVALDETAYRELFQQLLAAGGAGRPVYAKDPLDSGRFVYVSSVVPTGDWRVVLRGSEERVIGPVLQSVTQIVIISGAALLVVVWIFLITLNRMRRRIRKAVAAADHLAVGEVGEIEGLDTEGVDEIGQLSRSFAKVVASFRSINDVCVAIAAGDFSKSVPARSDRDVLAEAINEMTERRRDAEAELAAKEAQLRLALDNMLDGMFVMDADLNFIVVNERHRQLTGVPAEIFAPGKPVEAAVRYLVERGDYGPVDVEDFVTERIAQLASREPRVTELHNPDGTIVELRQSPAPTGGSVILSTDVTEQRRVEAAIRASEEQFRSLVDNVPGIVYRSRNDADWTMLYISEKICDLTGYPASEFLDGQRTFASIVHPEDLERIRAEIETSVAASAPFVIEYRVVGKDGETRWVQEWGQALAGETGDAEMLQGLFMDVTERKKTEEDLREKMRELERFNRLAVDRELRMIELKKEVNSLLVQSGQEAEYRIID